MERQRYINEINYNTLTIDEKIKFYNKNHFCNDSVVDEWIARKNLITNEVVDNICHFKGISKEEFAFGISNLTDSTDITINSWIKILKVILEGYNYCIDEFDFENGSLLRCIAPFFSYVEEETTKIISESGLKISKKALYSLLNFYAEEALKIVEKNLIIELNIFKDRYDFESTDTKEQFVEFSVNIFSGKEDFYKFYSKYAVSTRVLTERTLFFLSNTRTMFNRIKQNKKELLKKFEIKKFEIEDLTLSTGDSHEQGKSVAIIQFSDLSKLVYKPKNLDICESFNKFTQWINREASLLPIKNPDGLYKSDYAFIEFIEYKACESELEVEHYYERFGYLIALGYILSMTDIHYENIISMGEYPMIIDGETIFQNRIEFSNQESIITEFQNEYYFNTILSTALIPNIVKLDGELEVSGLSGDEQMSSKGFLAPVGVATSDFHYEKIDLKIDGAQNIPILSGEKKNYPKYIHWIASGFVKMSEFILNNRDNLLKEENPLQFFSDKKIRYLAKGTQKYAEMLDFMGHPSCNERMVERERILQNIWAYPHKNKAIILSEYRDMLMNDIPIFYCNTTSRDLFDSHGNKYANFFKRSGYDLVVERIQSLDTQQIDKQKEILLIHCGLYNQFKMTEFNKEEFSFEKNSINYIQESELIAKKIIKSSISNEKHILWPYVVMGDSQSSVGLTGVELYEGISGMSLFFLELFKATNKKEYLNIYYKCLNSCFEGLESLPTSWNGFEFKLSLIFPVLVEVTSIELSRERKEFLDKFVCNLIDDLYSNIDSKISSIDWITGLSSTLMEMLQVYEIYPQLDIHYLSKLKKVLKQICGVIIEQLNFFDPEIGQAHGYSGIALALSSYYKHFPNENLFSTIMCILEMEKKLVARTEVSASWCKGISGILIFLIKIHENVGEKEKVPEYIKDMSDLLMKNLKREIVSGDSLCHGKAGILLCVDTIIRKGFDKNGDFFKIKERIEAQIIGKKLCTGKYSLLQMGSIENPTLFTGLAGIGYMWLKLNDPHGLNILLFS